MTAEEVITKLNNMTKGLRDGDETLVPDAITFLINFIPQLKAKKLSGFIAYASLMVSAESGEDVIAKLAEAAKLRRDQRN